MDMVKKILGVGSSKRKIVSMVSGKKDYRFLYRAIACLVIGMFLLMIADSFHFIPVIGILLQIISGLIGFVLLIGVLVYLVSHLLVGRITNYFKSDVEKKLEYLIVTNGFYEQNETGICRSMRFSYIVDDEEIFIRAYKDGNKFTSKVCELDEQLSALIGRSVANKIDKVTHCDYYFNLCVDKRIVVGEDKQKYNKTTGIKLNSSITWDIAKQPHCLIAGGSGTGKTTMIEYIIIEFLKKKAEIYVADPKNSDLANLRFFLPNVQSDSNRIAKMVREVREIMDYRYETYKADSSSYGKNWVDMNLNPVVLIMDELGSLRAGSEKKVFDEIMKNLMTVILKGREMGVFVLLSTQQPNASNIPTEIRDNLFCRICLGNPSSQAVRMIFSDGIEDLETVTGIGEGHVYLDGVMNKPKFLQAPKLDKKTFDFIAEVKKYTA